MPAVPDDLALHTGPDAGALLEAALATTGDVLRDWQVRSVDVRPGSGTTVQYRADVRDGAVSGPVGGAGAGGSGRTVWLGASTRRLPAGAEQAAGALVLSDGDRQVAVWAWPRDPWLPALPLACDARAVRELLTSFGAPRDEVGLRVHAYRPGRRAVVHGASRTGSVYLKVQRPEQIADLHARHRLLAGAGLPVPRSLGVDARGLVALQALDGTPMRERLRTGGPVPSAQGLLGLLDRIPPAVLALPRRPGWADGARHYAAVVGQALGAAGRPEQAARAAGLADELLDGLQAALDVVEPVHGDLYEGQLLLGDDGEVSGLLDVDSAGPGRRADDLACLLAHLEVLAAMEPAHAASTRAQRTRWQAEFEERVDAVELRLRTAGVLLSLGTGPHRVQEQGWPQATVDRLDLVQDWVAAASGERSPSAAGVCSPSAAGV